MPAICGVMPLFTAAILTVTVVWLWLRCNRYEDGRGGEGAVRMFSSVVALR